MQSGPGLSLGPWLYSDVIIIIMWKRGIRDRLNERETQVCTYFQCHLEPGNYPDASEDCQDVQDSKSRKKIIIMDVTFLRKHFLKIHCKYFVFFFTVEFLLVTTE